MAASDPFQTFSHNEDKELIELVKKNQMLYNTELADYKDGALKDHVWGEIAAAMKKSSTDCKKRWKYLRDSYNRCKRTNKKRTGSASFKTTKWCFFNVLRFLDAHSEQESEVKIKTDNSNDEDSQPYDETNFEFCPVDDGDTKEEKYEKAYIIDTDVEVGILERKKRNCEQDSSYQNTEVPAKTKKRDDEIDSFCTYIGAILKKINPALRVEAKSKIFNLMSEYEMKDMNL
ncbi:uncharacterized protein LOC135082691 [Ostrinia nubilalis]|uniref:uncharacterized protein LOC135082691 n=1 Tax=Ostrinia nubilalis TaxID=29057 RepID=UPI0030826023